MKTLAGVVLGVVGYAAWRLSEPGPGESSELPARMARLKMQWRKATDEGRAAGEAKRRQMESEFEAVFKHQSR